MVDLEKKINLVLNEEKRSYQANGRSHRGGLGSFNINVSSGWYTPGKIPQLLDVHSSLDFIQSPNASVLLRLYFSLNRVERDEFKQILIRDLSITSPYQDVAYLLMFVLHRCGNTLEALKYSQKNLRLGINYSFSNLLATLSKIVQHEYSYFSEQLLENINEVLTNETEHSFQLKEKVNCALLNRLSKQLDTTNQQVNEDKIILNNSFELLGFPPDLAAALDKIDTFLNGAKDNFDFKSCMDLIRSFTERFYKSIADKMDPKNTIDEKDSEKVARYFKEKGLISDDQGEILVSIRHFLSNFASHRLQSKSEDARLSRNIAIEFSLYLIRRYEETIS